ncbi:hypothetical protein [Lysinibacillus sphaericus]|uniref:hypothetical protein n=1 Tax=Lysinibacillus sphaericus TaxID=1421 RepID=UPI0018CC7DCA|nr:hypothetical protein [Lysinibacillus sphaericus]
MGKFKIMFTATGKVVELTFSATPKLSDIFKYKNNYYMVVDYDGKYVHVVKVNKLEIT